MAVIPDRAVLVALVALVTVIGVIDPVRAHGPICNDYTPRCGLDPATARRTQLLSYSVLRDRVADLHRAAQARASVDGRPARLVAGPLLKLPASAAADAWAASGLLDIDVPLPRGLPPLVDSSVCERGLARGANASATKTATIRDSVVCTVTRHMDFGATARGNRDPAAVGLSKHGRRILAVRTGDPSGVRVVVITQVHGNEAASTEAALAWLESYARGTTCDAHRGSSAALDASTGSACTEDVLKGLDVLFILRGNPDAGEPDAEARPSISGPFVGTAGFFRQSIDATAGGGFSAPTEPAFHGVVGRGYDINRYLHTDLRSPIRPVEAQAIVAALLAFRPSVVLDLHGDVPKAGCELDARPVRVAASGLPSVRCTDPRVPDVPTLATARDNMVVVSAFADNPPEAGSSLERSVAVRRSRALAARVLRATEARVPGRFTRFSQLQVGSGRVSNGTSAEAAAGIGAIYGGWEVLNFVPTYRAAVLAVRDGAGGAPKFETGIEVGDIEACFLKDNICVHRLMLDTAVRELPDVMRLDEGERSDEDGFCAIPLADGLVADLPRALFGDAATEGIEMTPVNGAWPVPLSVSGVCPNDVGPVGGNGSAWDN